MLENKLELLREHDNSGRVKIMIIGLGSVGNYLLDYLMSSSDEKIEIIVAGRNREKMEKDVNIVKIASLIRRQNRSRIIVEDNVDLDNVSTIAAVLKKYNPDIIVNTSRVYSGLKYGTISWKNVRAYGIWIPLSIRYIRNIMLAYAEAGCRSIVINTSYSDGTIPWLKSAGIAYPDFGSGNLNHLLPRIRLAVARDKGIEDFWNIDVIMATAHFHDVVISKEGQNEGVEQLLKVKYKGKEMAIDQDVILKQSRISMPVDAKRNMMNASSNFDIIQCLLRAVRNKRREIFYSPGAFGEIGGYPVVVDGEKMTSYISAEDFSLDMMREKNKVSIALDGIEAIENGTVTYTTDLIRKAYDAFNVMLPESVPFEKIDETSQFIIKNIIEPQMSKL